jgi:hypothetical protein
MVVGEIPTNVRSCPRYDPPLVRVHAAEAAAAAAGRVQFEAAVSKATARAGPALAADTDAIGRAAEAAAADAAAARERLAVAARAARGGGGGGGARTQRVYGITMGGGGGFDDDGVNDDDADLQVCVWARDCE